MVQVIGITKEVQEALDNAAVRRFGSNSHRSIARLVGCSEITAWKWYQRSQTGNPVKPYSRLRQGFPES